MLFFSLCHQCVAQWLAGDAYLLTDKQINELLNKVSLLVVSPSLNSEAPWPSAMPALAIQRLLPLPCAGAPSLSCFRATVQNSYHSLTQPCSFHHPKMTRPSLCPYLSLSPSTSFSPHLSLSFFLSCFRERNVFLPLHLVFITSGSIRCRTN